MAQSTVNIQKMKTVSAELEKVYSSMQENKKHLDEIIAALAKIWAGEGAQAYQGAYQANAQNFVLLGEAIKSCSAALNASATSYSQADTAAADAIKAKLAKG